MYMYIYNKALTLMANKAEKLVACNVTRYDCGAVRIDLPSGPLLRTPRNTYEVATSYGYRPRGSGVVTVGHFPPVDVAAVQSTWQRYGRYGSDNDEGYVEGGVEDDDDGYDSYDDDEPDYDDEDSDDR